MALTQYQLAESARRKLASRNEGFDFIRKNHPPTIEELEKLKKRRPELWESYKPSKEQLKNYNEGQDDAENDDVNEIRQLRCEDYAAGVRVVESSHKPSA